MSDVIEDSLSGAVNPQQASDNCGAAISNFATDEDIDKFLDSLRDVLKNERPPDVNGYVHKYCQHHLILPKDPAHLAALLCEAAATGNASELQWLLDQGIDPNMSDYDLRTPLHLAAEECHMQCVEVLLKCEADVNAADRWGTTPLGGIEALMHVSEDTGRVVEVAELLRKAGGEVSMFLLPGVDENQPLTRRLSKNPKFELIQAASDGDLAMVRRLLESGTCSVNAVDHDSRCALHRASANGHLAVVKYLVEHGADVNSSDRHGQSAASMAAHKSHYNIATYLRDAGAAPKDDEPKTLEQYAAIAKKWWEDRLCVEAGLEAWSETVQFDVLERVLEKYYGFDLERNDPLREELEELESISESGTSEILRTTFMRVVLNFPGTGSHMSPSGLPLGLRQVNFPSGIFNPAVRRRPSMRQTSQVSRRSMSTNGDDKGEARGMLSKIVLNDLAIKNWSSFVAILENIYQKVLADETLKDGPAAGKNADYIPELRDAPSDRLAMAVCTVDGQFAAFGEADEHYSIQSTGKSFAYTLAMRQHTKLHDPNHVGPEGADYVHTYVGREPSGRAFNAFTLTRPDSRGIQHPFNPVSNAGAIVTCCMIDEHNELPVVPGNWRSPRIESRLNKYKRFLSDLSGGDHIGDCLDVFESERQEAYTNYALANVMMAAGTFPPEIKNHCDLNEAVDFYLRMCSTKVNTKMLAIMGATFATFGRCPLTGMRVTTVTEAKQTLAILGSCGMYDFSGEWACTVGLPAKSGVSGNIFIVIPGMMGLCVWSPRLDSHGNSVRGIRLAQMVKEHLSCSVLDLLSRAQESNMN